MSPTERLKASWRDDAQAEHVAALFDRESQGYDDAHEGPRARLLYARMTAVLDVLGDGPGKALDAGMGPGRLCAELERRGWTASGVDISERMVALAARRLPEAGDRLKQGSITALPFEDGSFDAVTATGVLEYLPDPASGTAELMRVLKPGGVAVVSIPNPASLRERWTRRVLYPTLRAAKRLLPRSIRPAPHRKPAATTVSALVDMLRRADGIRISVRYACVEPLPPPLDRAAPRLAERLALRLEAVPSRAARALASQVVVAVRKPRDDADTGAEPPRATA